MQGYFLGLAKLAARRAMVGRAGPEAIMAEKGARSRFILLSTATRDSIVLRSEFVEEIQHFAARPQYYNTQREDQKGSHFLISSWQPEQATPRLLGR